MPFVQTHNLRFSILFLGTSNANFKKRAAPAQKNTSKLDLGAVQKQQQQRKSQLPEKSFTTPKLKDVPAPKVPTTATAGAISSSEATKNQVVASTPPSSSSDAESSSSSSTTTSQQSATQATSTSFTGLIRQASLKNFFTRSNAGMYLGCWALEKYLKDTNLEFPSTTNPEIVISNFEKYYMYSFTFRI